MATVHETVAKWLDEEAGKNRQCRIDDEAQDGLEAAIRDRCEGLFQPRAAGIEWEPLVEAMTKAGVTPKIIMAYCRDYPSHLAHYGHYRFGPPPGVVLYNEQLGEEIETQVEVSCLVERLRQEFGRVVRSGKRTILTEVEDDEKELHWGAVSEACKEVTFNKPHGREWDDIGDTFEVYLYMPDDGLVITLKTPDEFQQFWNWYREDHLDLDPEEFPFPVPDA